MSVSAWSSLLTAESVCFYTMDCLFDLTKIFFFKIESSLHFSATKSFYDKPQF